MKTIIYGILCFLFAANLTAQTLTDVGMDERGRQLQNLERQRFEAMTKKDIPFLKSILADELTYSHSNGLVETKTDHLINIQSGDLVYKTMEPVVLEAKVYKKTAVLTGILHVTGTLKEKDFDVRLRYLDVYIKKKGKWQLVAWQSVKAE